MSPGGKPQQGGGGGAVKLPLKVRKVTISLTIPTCITFCIGLAVSYIVVFFFGVILGRGHLPEEKIPNLDKIMPKPASVSSIRIIATENPKKQAVVSNVNNGSVQPSVMTAQDLGFKESLKEKPKVATPSKKKLQQQRQERKTVTATAAKQTQEQGAKKETVLQKAAEQKFDYQFQVAAYKNRRQADVLTARLKKSGLIVTTEKTVERGGTWYKNMVFFRGTAADIEILRKKLQQHKITTLIRKSKNPVVP